MKFMDSGNSENESSNTPIIKAANGVDLMKSEKGFENIVGSEPTTIVEPMAKPITNPEQLNSMEAVVPTVEDKTNNNLFNTVVDNDPMGLNTKTEEVVQTNGVGAIVSEMPAPANAASTLTSTMPTQNTETVMPAGETKDSQAAVNTSNNQLPFMETKKKGVSGILVALLIIMFFVASGCVYYFLFLSPEKIITKSLGTFYEETKKLYTKYENIMSSTSIHSKGSLEFESKNDDLAMFNGYKIDYDLGYDKTNKKVSSNIGLSAGTEKLLNMMVFYKENYGYINVTGITPKTIKYDMTDYEEYFEIDEKKEIDINYLVTVLGNAFQKNMSKNKISKKISYGDPIEKKLGVVLTYDMDSKEYRKVVTAMVDALSTDTKSLDMLKLLYDYETTDEVKEKLTEQLQYTDFNIEDTKISIMIDIFTSKILYFEINNSKVKTTIKEENSVIKINSTAFGEEVKSINLEYNKVTSELKILYSMLNEEVTSTADIIIKTTDKGEKKSETTMSIIVIPDTVNQNDTLELTIVNNTEFDSKIEDIDVSEAVFMEELTEEELTQMSDALLGLVGLFGLGELEM